MSQSVRSKVIGGEDREHTQPTLVPDGGEKQFGRYRLCFELASGGMATVFLASAQGPAGFEKLVALKRIHPHLAKERSFVQMFLDEARIASRIGHPNVCGVFDFGQANGIYYLAMEYLVGESAARLIRALQRDPALRHNPRLPTLAARVMADACEGLHAAHELKDPNGQPLQVVHRDVSPHNIFITYDGGVRIVDFGIASAANRLHETTTGMVKGKFAYMAPEQVRGLVVDRRADVWSVGVVLWELLTQRRLFRRQVETETIFAVATDPIKPPSSVRDTVPAELDAIVLRALNRDPDLRYPTAREMSKDLTRFIGSQREPTGMADVAEWMEVLFPAGLARKQQMIEIARQADQNIPRLDDEPDPISVEVSLDSASRVRESPFRELLRRRYAWVGVTAALALVIGVTTFSLAKGAREGGPTAGDPPFDPDPTTVTPPTPPAKVATPANAVPEVLEPNVGETPSVVETDIEANPPRPPPIKRTKVVSPPPPVGNGLVSVSTPGGWANVYFRGRLLGPTPGRYELPAGRQSIEIRPSGGGRPRRVVVDVRPGQGARVSIPLETE